MSFTTNPLTFPSYDEDMFSYDTALASGMPSLAPLIPPGLPQYSSLGRMEPEFLGAEVAEIMDEDERSIVARGRTIRILDFSPREGQSGTVIVIRLVFIHGTIAPKTKVAFRVKMGNIPLMTSILGVQPSDEVGGHWELQVVAPDPIELSVVGFKVPLIIQALDVTNTQIVDDVCIGTFKFVPLANESVLYSIYDGPTSAHGAASSNYVQGNSVIESNESFAHPRQLAAKYDTRRKRANLSIEVPSQGVPGGMDSEPSPETSSPLIARNPPSQLPQKPGEDAYPGSDDEERNGRRLVEFFCTRKHGHINVGFAPVYGDDALDSNRSVVSCIWWDEMEDFVITSVDTISLLEKLVGTKFTTEEKNRIRRNLQGFKPSTISKNQPESESFFKLLMEFPPPRPRHIEKDVKAFPWSKLASMLEKIITKYWFITSPGGSESEDPIGSQNVRVVRGPEGMPGDSPGVVGLSFSAPSPTQALNSETQASRTGTLPVSGYFVAAPLTSGHTSLSQARPTEDSVYPQGARMELHESSALGPETLMEISEDSKVRSLPTAGNQDYAGHAHPGLYPAPFNLSPANGVYGHNTGAPEEQGLRGDIPFTTHTLHEFS
ncbi:hypothetical protein FRC07_000730 [Ceratobasidium sp. 392]|nr:hypothetical protein FRC07_000730 [Ceratobasidium sp. 392]